MTVKEIGLWIFIFFLYSFFGWVWESCYRSVKQKKFVNRGYLNGPWLPIYGFSALIILYLTYPFKERIAMVFLVGALSVSIIEVVVGLSMEKLFHLRYWDDRGVPLNYKGYIALPSSLLWGVLAVLLVRFADHQVMQLTACLPLPILYVADSILLALFLFDVILSTIQALHLKRILHNNIQSINERNKRLRKQVKKHRAELNEKVLKKAEKALKRNPSIFSSKHNAGLSEMRTMINEIKDKLNKDQGK